MILEDLLAAGADAPGGGAHRYALHRSHAALPSRGSPQRCSAAASRRPSAAGDLTLQLMQPYSSAATMRFAATMQATGAGPSPSTAMWCASNGQVVAHRTPFELCLMRSAG